MAGFFDLLCVLFSELFFVFLELFRYSGFDLVPFGFEIYEALLKLFESGFGHRGSLQYR